MFSSNRVCSSILARSAAERHVMSVDHANRRVCNSLQKCPCGFTSVRGAFAYGQIEMPLFKGLWLGDRG